MAKPDHKYRLIQQLVRMPLAQFLALGFIAWLLLGSFSQGNERSSAIVVSKQTQDQLREKFSQTMLRAPTPAELAALVDRYIREEIYVREGLALGLDQDDPVIRLRIFSKVEFLLRAQLAPAEPVEAELQQYLLEHRDKYQAIQLTSFRQRWMEDAADAEQLLAALAAGETVSNTRSALLPVELTDRTAEDIDRVFGTGFSEQLESLPLDSWAGPLQSGYGRHLVYVSGRKTIEALQLPNARQQLVNDWKAAQQSLLDEKALAELRKKYDVSVATDE